MVGRFRCRVVYFRCDPPDHSDVGPIREVATLLAATLTDPYSTFHAVIAAASTATVDIWGRGLLESLVL